MNVTLLNSNQIQKNILPSYRPYKRGSTEAVYNSLPADTVCFTGKIPRNIIPGEIKISPAKYRTATNRDNELVNRIFRENFWNTDIYERLPIFDKAKSFGIDEYKTLAKDDIKYVKTFLKKKYFLGHTIENDFKQLFQVTDDIKKYLDKKYKNGYIFASVGGSPSLFAKIMEQMGADTKIIPFSKKTYRYSYEKNPTDFKKYLENFGLNKEFLKNNKKHIIFTDYEYTGDSLLKFCNAYRSTGLKANDVEFLSLWKLITAASKEKIDKNINYTSELKSFMDYFFQKSVIKSYSPCPTFNTEKAGNIDLYDDIEKVNKAFKWNLTTKLMNFSVVDYLVNNAHLPAQSMLKAG